MLDDTLATTMEQLTQQAKGILAADESTNTIGKRFQANGIENSEDNRRAYRLLLATTHNLSQYISGVILFAETFTQNDIQGNSIPELFLHAGILPGIKVDQGLVKLSNTKDEYITQGLDGLEERLEYFKNLGAKFAKWRNVYSITSITPSRAAIKSGAEVLARYAASCQAANIVPIVEPELLMEGTHRIETCAYTYAEILHELFNALFIHNIKLEHIILKPSMITSGKDSQPFSSPQEVAESTINIFRNHVPAAVPTINFLSGGQSPELATINLSYINSQGHQPWKLSFSYGRALQENCLRIWQGKTENIKAAQEALLNSACLNSKASLGSH